MAAKGVKAIKIWRSISLAESSGFGDKSEVSCQTMRWIQWRQKVLVYITVSTMVPLMQQKGQLQLGLERGIPGTLLKHDKFAIQGEALSKNLNVCMCVLSHFSHVQLFAILWTIAHQAPQSIGFSRQEYRSGLPLPSSGDLLNSGIKPVSLVSPALAGRFFSTSITQKFEY